MKTCMISVRELARRIADIDRLKWEYNRTQKEFRTAQMRATIRDKEQDLSGLAIEILRGQSFFEISEEEKI